MVLTLILNFIAFVIITPLAITLWCSIEPRALARVIGSIVLLITGGTCYVITTDFIIKIYN